MEVPSVAELREQVGSSKQETVDSTLKEKQDKLKSILEHRAENREKWDEEKRNNYNMFLANLLKYHNETVDALTTEIVNRARTALENGRSYFLFTDPQEYVKGDFKPNALLYGFWNPERKLHNRLSHIEAGIHTTPFKQLQENLLPKGYVLQNISDTSKSFRTYWKVMLN